VVFSPLCRHPPFGMAGRAAGGTFVCCRAGINSAKAATQHFDARDTGRLVAKAVRLHALTWAAKLPPPVILRMTTFLQKVQSSCTASLLCWALALQGTLRLASTSIQRPSPRFNGFR
jgi:hypothetical protein